MSNIWTLWDEIITFNDSYFPEWKKQHPVFLSNALAGETGEVCEATKHQAGGGTKVKYIKNDDILDELFDVFVYLTLLAEVMGGKDRFITAGYEKLEILEKRMQK